jgi:hypothetical protein
MKVSDYLLISLVFILSYAIILLPFYIIYLDKKLDKKQLEDFFVNMKCIDCNDVLPLNIANISLITKDLIKSSKIVLYDIYKDHILDNKENIKMNNNKLIEEIYKIKRLKSSVKYTSSYVHRGAAVINNIKQSSKGFYERMKNFVSSFFI